MFVIHLTPLLQRRLVLVHAHTSADQRRHKIAASKLQSGDITFVSGSQNSYVDAPPRGAGEGMDGPGRWEQVRRRNIALVSGVLHSEPE